MLPTARISTALALITIIVTGVLFLSTVWVGVMLGVVVLIGMAEWASLAGISNYAHKITVTLTCAALMLGLIWLLLSKCTTMLPALAATVLWWITTAWRLAIMQTITPRHGVDPVTAITGILVLLSTWGSVIWLHLQPNGRWLLLFFLTLIWTADSGAYFVGHRWGKTQLAPLLSPRKTTEGVYGALIGSTICGFVLATFYGNNLLDRVELILLCLLAVGASIIGDLYESLLKRERCLKDSGSLLPGHGGILDRIDSITAAAPVFALGLALLRIIK